jgi:tyrosyl-tRNA synthetase
MSIDDNIMFKYYELTTDIPMDEVNRMKEDMLAGKMHPKDIKVRLAKELCTQFYDQKTADEAEAEFNRIFVNKDTPDEIPEFKVKDSDLKDDKIWIVKLMVLAGLTATNGEARRLITSGAVTFENEKIADPDLELPKNDGIIKVGKRKFVKILFS